MKMRKWMALVLALAMTVLVLAGCGSSAADDPAAGADDAAPAASTDGDSGDLGLLNDGVLMIGTDDTMPPMEYRDDSDALVGFDVEMGDEIGRRLGVEVQWVPTDWDGLLMGLSSNKYDCVISLICVTEEREKTMDFSDPYYVLEELIVARADDDSVNAIADLPGKKVGCQTGSANYNSLIAMEDVNADDVAQYNAVTDELQDVISGRLDCAVMEGPTAYFYSQANDALKVVSDDPIEGHDVAIAYNKGNAALQEAVNAVLAEMKEDGTLSELSVKWFGVDVYA